MAGREEEAGALGAATMTRAWAREGGREGAATCLLCSLQRSTWCPPVGGRGEREAMVRMVRRLVV